MSGFQEFQNEPLGFFIYDYSTGGGVERVTANLMKLFAAAGFTKLILISFPPSNSEPVMAYPENPEIRTISRKNLKQDLSNLLKKEKISRLIYQADNMGIALEVLAASRETGTKAYGQYHGSPYAYLKKYSDAERTNLDKKAVAAVQYPFKLSKLKKVIGQSVDDLYCVSEGSCNELKELFPSEKLQRNISVIRNPILLEDRIALPKEKRVTLVSRLERKHKNAFLAVKAWQKIHKKFPNWTLEILGDGSLLEKMKEFCRQHQIENIRFKGFVKNVDQELAKSSISINVSNCEGFSMSVAEAIVQGNAIAATDSDGGASDMLIANETSLISPKNDADALADNLALLMSDEVLREKLAEKAQSHLQKMASVDVLEQWCKVLFKK